MFVAVSVRMIVVDLVRLFSDRLAVGFLAMQHSEDLERIAEVVEADTVVAEAEAQFQRFDIGQALDVAVACQDEIGQAFEQAHGSGGRCAARRRAPVASTRSVVAW